MKHLSITYMILHFVIYASLAQNSSSQNSGMAVAYKVNIKSQGMPSEYENKFGATYGPFSSDITGTLINFFTGWLSKNKTLPTYEKLSPKNSNEIIFSSIDNIADEINATTPDKDFILPEIKAMARIKKNQICYEKQPVFNLSYPEDINTINAITFLENWTINAATGEFIKEVKNIGLNAVKDNREYALLNLAANSFSKAYYRQLDKNYYALSNEMVLADNIVYDVMLNYNSVADPNSSLTYGLMNATPSNYYHYVDEKRKTTFLTQLIEIVKNRNCRIYKTDRNAADITKELSHDEIIHELIKIDSVYIEDPETEMMRMVIHKNELQFSNIIGLRFYETWYYDKENFSIKKIVKAVGPLETYYDYNEYEMSVRRVKPRILITLNNKVQDGNGNTLDEKLSKSESNYGIGPSLYKAYSEGKYYLVNNEGVNINNNRYFWIEDRFINGLLKVVNLVKESDSSSCYIDNFGNVGKTGEYGEVLYDDSYRYCGYINHSGKEIVPCKYNKVERMENGLFFVTLNNKEGLLDSAGKTIAEPMYDKISFTSPIPNLISVFKGEMDYGVYGKGKFGLMDHTGKFVFPVIYDKITSIDTGLILFVKDDERGIYNRDGKLISDFPFDRIGEFYKGFAVVEKDQKKGLMNKEGKLICPCIYDNFENKNNGIFKVSKNGKYGFVKSDGKVLIECKYDDFTYPFKNLLVFKKDGLFGFVDSLGQEVVPAKYQVVTYYNRDTIKVFESGNYYFADQYGKNLGPCPFDNVFRQNDTVNFSCVGRSYYTDNGYHYLRADMNDVLFFLTDNNNHFISTQAYSGFENFTSGLAAVQRNNKIGFIDLTGKEIVPCRYSDIIDWNDKVKVLYEGKMEWEGTKKGKISFFNTDSHSLTETAYDHVSVITASLMAIYKNNQLGFLNSRFEEINYGKYDWMPYDHHSIMGNGLRRVYKGETDSLFSKGKFGAVDSTGKEVIPCRYNWIYAFEDELDIARVFIGKVNREGVPYKGKFSLVSSKGKELIPFRYDYIYSFEKNTAVVFTGIVDSIWGGPDQGKYGLINDKGVLIIPLKYDDIQISYYDEYYHATLGEKKYKYDYKGKLISEE